MRNRKLVLVALLAAFALLVAACGDDEGEGAGMKMCQVTDFGGIDDQSFNQTAWKGFQQAKDELGVDVSYLESDDATDYAPNIQSFMDQGCKLIVTVGYNLAADTARYACNNPNQLFAILDETPAAIFPGSAWADADGNALCEFTNVRGITFQTDEAAFLAGYVAAGATETGVVATFGGIAYPTVTIFMNGFAYGVEHYNEVHGTNVRVLGWNPATQEGIFVGNFESQDDGRAQGESLNDEGADIILPVAGPVGLGTAAAAAERGFLVVGVDADQYLAAPEYASAWLTSIMKNMDVAVLETVTNVVETGKVGDNFIGTLANGGLSLAPYHDNADRVSDELAAEVEQLKADIISAGGLAAFMGG